MAIDILLTDPPYNVNYQGGTKDKLKIANDNLPDAHFRKFLVDSLSKADLVMKPGAAFYIWHADSEGYNFRGACRDIGWTIRECIIWVKNTLVLGRQDYQWRHEPCLYGWKDGAAHYFINDRSITTVFEGETPDFEKMKKPELIQLITNIISEYIDNTTTIECNRPSKSDIHPTMKPVELFEKLVNNSSQPGWNVMDLFAGSGTTLMVCEKLKRKAYCMEYDPRYADAIVRRYIKMTKDKSIRCIRKGKEMTLDELPGIMTEDVNEALMR